MKDLYTESGRLLPRKVEKLSEKEFIKVLQENVGEYERLISSVSISKTSAKQKEYDANVAIENVIYLMQEYYGKLDFKHKEKLRPFIQAIPMEPSTISEIKTHLTYSMERFYEKKFDKVEMPRFSIEKNINSVKTMDDFRAILKSSEFELIKEKFPKYFEDAISTIKEKLTYEYTYGGNKERLLLSSTITDEINYLADMKPLESKGDYKKALQSDFEDLKIALEKLEQCNPHNFKERLSYPQYAKNVVPYREALLAIKLITERPSFAKNTNLPWLEKLQQNIFEQIAGLDIDPRIVNDLLANDIKLPGHEQEIHNNKTSGVKFVIHIDKNETSTAFKSRVTTAEKNRNLEENKRYNAMIEAEDNVKKALHKVNKMAEEEEFKKNANFGTWSWADDYKRAQLDLEIAKTKLKEAEIKYENFMNS